MQSTFVSLRTDSDSARARFGPRTDSDSNLSVRGESETSRTRLGLRADSESSRARRRSCPVVLGALLFFQLLAVVVVLVLPTYRSLGPASLPNDNTIAPSHKAGSRARRLIGSGNFGGLRAGEAKKSAVIQDTAAGAFVLEPATTDQRIQSIDDDFLGSTADVLVDSDIVGLTQASVEETSQRLKVVDSIEEAGSAKADVAASPHLQLGVTILDNISPSESLPPSLAGAVGEALKAQAAALDAAQAQRAGGKFEALSQLWSGLHATTSPRQTLDPKEFLIRPTHPDALLQDYHKRVTSFLVSSQFEDRKQKLEAETAKNRTRGIVICAGGGYYMFNAMVLLRALRDKLGCTLPIELVWMGSGEMRQSTFEQLQKRFAPLFGLDALAVPGDEHYLPDALRKSRGIQKFPIKAFALLNSRFTEVILLDADIVPMRDPAYLFDTPEYNEQGNLFWKDLTRDAAVVADDTYRLIGLDPKVKPILDQGRGLYRRSVDSGIIIINRAKHLDVLEWAWWINSFGEHELYSQLYGDKDTFPLSFALAGKPHNYQQNGVPPGAIFTSNLAFTPWAINWKMMARMGRRWMNGMVHYDPYGQVLLVHRTTGEPRKGEPTPIDELITEPIPLGWSELFMNDHHDDTFGVEPMHIVHINRTQVAEVRVGDPCPTSLWLQYWPLLEHGIPLQRNAAMEAVCEAGSTQLSRDQQVLMAGHNTTEQPFRLLFTKDWDRQTPPGTPGRSLLAAPLGDTEAWSTWVMLAEGVKYAQQFSDSGNL